MVKKPAIETRLQHCFHGNVCIALRTWNMFYAVWYLNMSKLSIYHKINQSQWVLNVDITKDLTYNESVCIFRRSPVNTKTFRKHWVGMFLEWFYEKFSLCSLYICVDHSLITTKESLQNI